MTISRILAFLAFVCFLVAFVLVLASQKGEGVELLTLAGLGSLALAHCVDGAISRP
jgi:peptidoglycan/LPS O-acetylase OafA/YrhL